MKYSRILIFALVIVMVVTVVSSLARFAFTPKPGPTPTPTAQPTPTPIAGYLVHIDEANGFTISYPEDWEVIPEESYVGGVLIAYSSYSDCGGSFQSLNVGQSELPQPTSVHALFEQEKVYLATLEGYTPVSEEDLFQDGMPAIKHVYTLVRNEVTMEIMEALIVEGTTAWFIACECAASCWSAYEPTFDIIVSTFHLLR